MTLEDLLKRATASEHVLITTVLKLAEVDATKTVRARAGVFIVKNLPPHRHDPDYDVTKERWLRGFNESLNGEGK